MNQEYKIFLNTNILVHASLKDYEPEKYNICSQILKNFINNIFIIIILGKKAKEKIKKNEKITFEN